jgi:phosphohistidine phosphatase
VDLLVIRHAIAAARRPAHTDADDAARALTRKGEKRFTQIVRGLDALGLELGRVLHSPWCRAAETACLLAPIVRGELERALASTELLIAPPAAALCAEIAAAGADGAVGVVGHEPWLGELVALLCFADPRRGEQVPLKKGGVAWLEGTAAPGGMVLRALLPPRVVRKIRR